MAENKEPQKRLIPIKIVKSDNNVWDMLPQEEGYDKYNFQADEDTMRKVLLRMKAKDSVKGANSKRFTTYKDMFKNGNENLVYCWKSKYPKSQDDLNCLMESVKDCVCLSNDYIFEGVFVEKGTFVRIVEDISFVPSDVWNKAKELETEDERVEYIKSNIKGDFTEEEIRSFVKKNM